MQGRIYSRFEGEGGDALGSGLKRKEQPTFIVMKVCEIQEPIWSRVEYQFYKRHKKKREGI